MFDLGCPESIADPAGYFASARAADGNVQWSDAQRAWAVLSHAEAERAFRDGERLSSDRSRSFQRAAANQPALQQAAELLAGWMNFRDPPVHERLREPVKAAFTPRAIAALESDIESSVGEVLTSLGDGPVDLNREFARPVPALVIGALLGVDPADRPRLQEWSDDLAAIVFAMSPGSVPGEQVSRATAEFTEYFSRLIERERAEPRGTLLTAIVHSDIAELSPMELVGACTLLLFGGHETTMTLLGNAIGRLLDDPELRERLRREPGLWPTITDEFIRTGGPARSMVRKVLHEHERGGRSLKPGDTVFISIAAANHDPAEFADPHQFDPARDPNPHLGFGWGLHFCLGANLARLEARLALRTLLERYPALEPAGPVPPPRANALGFGRRPLVARLR